MPDMDNDDDSDYPGTEAELLNQIAQMRLEIKEAEHAIEYNEGEIMNIEEELERRRDLPGPSDQEQA